MIKFGITGNIAVGKSVVENILSDKGFKVIDADKIAHDLLDSEVIHNTFAELDIFENGQISRERFGKIVFSNPEIRKQLENILHPQIRMEIEKFFSKHANEKYIFVSIPLLFEAKMEDMFDKIILICADDTIRLNRLIKRNGYSEKYARQRMSCQISQDKKKEKSDIVIYNNTTLEDLTEQISKIVE